MSDDLGDLRRRLTIIDQPEEETKEVNVASTIAKALESAKVLDAAIAKKNAPELTDDDRQTPFNELPIPKRLLAMMEIIYKMNGTFYEYSYFNSLDAPGDLEVNLENSDDSSDEERTWNEEEIYDSDFEALIMDILELKKARNSMELYEGTITIRIDGKHTYSRTVAIYTEEFANKPFTV